MKRKPTNPRTDRRVFTSTAKRVHGRNDSFYSRTGKRL